ncbi:MAG: histidine phosphatase family protein [Candidatus Paceibacterota bacterium]|jgi:broad specificity phosphatase PhoE
MKPNLKNKYFLLRHGKTIHQTGKKDITYGYPDDNPPCVLLKEGIREAQLAGEKLKEKNIDLIFASDILRVKQTVKIAAKIIGYNPDNVIYDQRLRDVNWGIFAGKNKKEAWAYYDKDMLQKFEKPVPQGESWNQCRERMAAVLNEIEKNFEKKNVLIVSHGDPLWLLEGYLKGKSNEELINEMNNNQDIKTGEIREI